MSIVDGGSRKKRRVMVRRKRSLDPNLRIDYKKPEVLKRFITDRGKIIPRRISGASASAQREICVAIKRARYLALLPYCVSHRPERGFSGEMAAATAVAARFQRPHQNKYQRQPESESFGSDGEE